MSEWMNGRMKASNPDMLHARSDERGYVLLDITPKALTCDFRATPHPVRAESRLRTQARYVVERSVPGLHRVNPA
jgi:alkaline phosphatase D